MARAEAQKPVGPDHKHRGHHHEDEHQGDGGQHEDAEGVELGHDQRRDEGASDAPQAADDHDDEDLDDDAQVHRVVDRIARELERAAERREEHPEGEDAGEEPLLVHAQRRDHVAVLRRRPHQYAEAGTVEQEPEQAEHQGPERDEHEIVGGHRLAEHGDGAAKPRSARSHEVLRSPDHDGEVFDRERHAEGGEQLEQVRRVVDAP